MWQDKERQIMLTQEQPFRVLEHDRAVFLTFSSDEISILPVIKEIIIAIQYFHIDKQYSLSYT